MTVYAWILFVITALVTLGSLYNWFCDGENLLTFFGSAGGLVYFIFYLFITPFSLIATWVYFICSCLFALIGLLLKKGWDFTQFTAYAIFFALVLF